MPEYGITIPAITFGMILLAFSCAGIIMEKKVFLASAILIGGTLVIMANKPTLETSNQLKLRNIF